MGSLDDFNDRWGNMGRSQKRFFELYPNEKAIYRSSGALFKRRGDTPFRRWTSFLNKRGNVIISSERCFFSNPTISGEILVFLMVPFILFLVGFLALLSFLPVYIFTGSILIGGICGLMFVPLLILVSIVMGLNVYQRLPLEIDLDMRRTKKRYLGNYQSLTRVCPLFSCYDGKNTYHFLGYRVMDGVQSEKIGRIFKDR